MKNQLRTLLLTSLTSAILLVLAIAASAQASHYTFTSIANLADYGGYFEPATLNNRGDVLFAPAMVTPAGTEGVLLWRSGVLTTIASGCGFCLGGS